MMTAQNTPIPSVDVTGEGIVKVVPDEVTVNVRVENTGKDAKALKRQNDATVNDVLAFVKRMGIADKYVSTQYVRLSKNYEYNTKTYNYSANQAISIKITDLKKYEDVMNGLIETGINRIDGISFSSSQANSLKSEARKKAVENAKLKATEYASVLNQTVGKAIHISEFQNTISPQPKFARALSIDGESSGGQQTLAPGEMEIQVRVNVSFQLL